MGDEHDLVYARRPLNDRPDVVEAAKVFVTARRAGGGVALQAALAGSGTYLILC